MRLVLIAFFLTTINFDAAQAVELTWEQPTEEQIEHLKLGLVEASALKDPFSIQFRSGVKVKAFMGSSVFCGYLNSKNSLGAYTGWKKFTVSYLKVGEGEGKWLSNVDDGGELGAAFLETFCKDYEW